MTRQRRIPHSTTVSTTTPTNPVTPWTAYKMRSSNAMHASKIELEIHHSEVHQSDIQAQIHFQPEIFRVWPAALADF
eukprot:1247931-Amorphochlora_amoeboformis.AAC.1